MFKIKPFVFLICLVSINFSFCMDEIEKLEIIRLRQQRVKQFTDLINQIKKLTDKTEISMDDVKRLNELKQSLNNIKRSGNN